MPTLVITLDGAAIRQVQLAQERTTIGRRPYNDVVIDNLAVSGEHAVLHALGDHFELEDLHSTNGTYVNGERTYRRTLHHGDMIEMGRYKIRFLYAPPAPGAHPPAAAAVPAAPRPAPESPAAGLMGASMSLLSPIALDTQPSGMQGARIRVLSGPAAGREALLYKVVTTVGKPGVGVASITHRQHGFVLTHIDGAEPPLLNGQPLGHEPTPLHSGDRIALAGAEMEFLLDA